MEITYKDLSDEAEFSTFGYPLFRVTLEVRFQAHRRILEIGINPKRSKGKTSTSANRTKGSKNLKKSVEKYVSEQEHVRNCYSAWYKSQENEWISSRQWRGKQN
ncbi:Uncharacterized protein Fot_42565 [Forsythia ovata]|uniref:Uncharacterized protein n=1 Tax=Forsythia ovata TaxID=205694 RepID=A0ABD1RLI6_9LAMI